MNAEPQQEHRWLHKLIGEWTYEGEATMTPGAPPEKFSGGAESVRSVGGLWVVAEGRGEMPGGGPSTSIMTLGFDPRTGRVVGSWIGSMMTHCWIYDGEIDPDRNVLALYADGPGFADQAATAKYRDVIEFKSDDHRVLTGSVLGDDGGWTTFMTAHYRRRK